MNRVLLTLVGLMALTFLRAEGGGCDSTIVGDPTMDLWCGKTLCAWTVEKGKIQRVTTWHRSDYGVGLVGDEVIISQQAKQGLHDTDCLEFRLQADHADGVNLFIEIDFMADGTVDYSQPLDSDTFRPSIFYLKPPMTLAEVRFLVRKAGSGAATLAEVKIKKVGNDHCAGVQPISLSDLADGSICTRAGQCLGGQCQTVTQWPRWIDVDRDVCGSCTTMAGCPGGRICGLTWSSAQRYLHQACVDKGQRLLGERCMVKASCASGICCEGVCSSCCQASADLCAVGSCNTPSWPTLGDDFRYTPLPSLCSPGGGAGASGGACLHDADCASGSCKGGGLLKICLMDGRTCKDDADCPFDNGKCLELGQANGLCQ